MPKLPILKPKKVIQKFKRLGFVEDHISGSHVIFYHPKTKRRVVIPFHLKDLKPGTLSAILRESGVLREEFLKV